MEKEVFEVYLDDIIPNRFQPREKFNDESIRELSESIKKYGVIQPLVLRKIGDKYEIIAGERRYKASGLAGLEKVPAIIKNLDDEASAEVALIENLQREDLTAIEKARSYKKLLAMSGETQESLARKLGVSQPALANTLRLLNLDETVQNALLNRKISERHARSLLTVTDVERQKELLNRVINERLTVRKLDSIIKGNKSSGDSEEGSVQKIIEYNPLLQPDKKEEEKEMNKELIPEIDPIKEIPQEKIMSQPVAPIETDLTKEINPNSVTVADIEPIVVPTPVAPVEQAVAPVMQEPTQVVPVEPIVPTQSAAPILEESTPVLEATPIKDIQAIKENAKDLGSDDGKPDFDMLLKPDSTPEPQVELPKEEQFVDFPQNIDHNLDEEVTNMGMPSFTNESKFMVTEEESSGTQKVEEPASTPKSVLPEFPEIAPVTEQPQVNIEPTVTPVVPVQPIESSVKPTISPLMQEIKTEAAPIVQPVVEPVVQVAPVEEKNTPAGPPPGNLRVAINTIRRSVDIISSNGVMIDSDEMDLENEYKFTITITKR